MRPNSMRSATGFLLDPGGDSRRNLQSDEPLTRLVRMLVSRGVERNTQLSGHLHKPAGAKVQTITIESR
jgi:hypothetical protein